MNAARDPSAAAADAVAATDPTSLPTAADLVKGLAATFLRGSAITRASVGFAAELTRIALGRSEVSRAIGLALQGPDVVAEPALQAGGPDLLGVMRGGRQGGRRDGAQRVPARAWSALGSPRASHQRGGADERAAGQPGGAQADLRDGWRQPGRAGRELVSDLRHNGGMPSMAKPGALKVGEDLALTPGAVIDKDDRAELMQYAPDRPRSCERPMLVVPPPIGRYYFLDLRPGRSFVEYSVSAAGCRPSSSAGATPARTSPTGTSTPTPSGSSTAIDAVREVTGCDDVNVDRLLRRRHPQHRRAQPARGQGDDRIHSASYAVTLLDFGQSAPIGAFSSARLLSLARWNSRAPA